MTTETRNPSLLFSPWQVRGVQARNRVVVSPMCMYSSQGRDGLAQDYHLVHLGRFALGGAGMVIVEATAVEPRGMISGQDLGLWSDDQVAGLARIASFLRAHGAVPGIQLSHAGRKAAVHAPWLGGRPLTPADALAGHPPWPVVGPSAVAAGPGRQVPETLSTEQIAQLLQTWVAATRRATQAGFEVIELHGAHGYLLHSFLSPLSNQRTDRYGGSPANRMRFPLEVVDAVRAALPSTSALFYRVSAVDNIQGGLTIDDTVEFAQALYAHGVDLIDTSSGSLVSDRSVDSRVRRGFGFHAAYSAQIKQATGGLVGTVGLIVEARQAEGMLRKGEADLVFLARELLSNPQWPLHAQAELEGHHFGHWHKQVAYVLESRRPLVEALLAAGETPLNGYACVAQEHLPG